MATAEKLFRGIFSFISISITAILLNFPFVAAASTGLVNSNLDVSMHTGAATLSVPIEVPPGRNGIQPNLALTYNSYRGNGWIGVGWDLDLGAIQRSTKFGVDYDANDFVAMDGSASELVPRPEWGSGYYGAKIEGAFTKYYFNPATGGWEATSRDGIEYFYGTTSSSRQDDPLDNGRVFKWCLDRVEDTSGNYMTVSYTKDQGQIYLKRIDYTGNGSLSPSNYVKFYLTNRNDAPVMYATNFGVTTAKRLEIIETYGNGQLSGKYRLNYMPYSNNSSRSLMTSFLHYGSDGETVLEDKSFSWQGGIDGWKSIGGISGNFGPGQGYADNNRYPLVIGDFNGDGKTDVGRVHQTGVSFYLSNGSGGWKRIGGINGTLGPGQGYADNNRYPLVIGDFNGDGKTDVGRVHQTGVSFYLSNGSGGWKRIGGISGNFGPGQGYADDNRYPLVIGDFNGDGKTDVGRVHQSGVSFYLSDGSGGWKRIGGISGNFGPGQGYADDNRYPLVIGDFNGDGKTDVGRVHQSGVSFYLSDGSGGWKRIGGINGTLGPGQGYADNNRYPLVIGDFNGDGKTDVGRVHQTGVSFYLSNGSGGWKRIGGISGNFGPGQGYADDNRYPLVIGDFNGDGKTDVGRVHQSGVSFYLSDGSGGWKRIGGINGTLGPGQGYADNNRYPLVIGDFNGDGKTDESRVHQYGISFYLKSKPNFQSDLISNIYNGAGGTTIIEYTPSSAYTNTLLPFIMQPVSKITVDDGLGNSSTTEYSYSGGLYDYSTREFRGFETVTQKAAVGTASEIWTETKFHQDEYYKGRQDQVNLKKPDDPDDLLSQTKFSWGKSDVGPPGNQSAFVKLIEKHTESYDDETVAVQEAYEYDDTNGNLLLTTVTNPDAESVTTSFLYENFGDWLWRKTQETVEGGLSGKVRESYYNYEPDTGNLLYKEFWLDTGPNPRIQMTYDEYGNQETVTDARRNTTVTEYDPATHTYPVRITYPETNGVSHIVENEEWDYRFGKVTVIRDENGNRTDYDYDEFGRLALVDSPDGGQVTTEYHDDVFPRYVVTKSKENDAGDTIDHYQYFDGLGREVQSISFGEGGKAIVTQKYYDEMGRNDLAEGPFFDLSRDYKADPPDEDDYPITPPAEYPWTQTTFDERGRPDTVENSDGEYGSVLTTFSYSGLSTTIKDPDGGSKTEKKDFLRRVVQVIEHADNGNYDTNYVYNVAGDLLQVIDFYGNTTTINYDSLGRKLNMTDQDMGFWVYTYDENGNLYTQKDQKEQTVTFAYDELNRVTSKSYDTSDPTVNYSYGNLSIPNGRGRLFSVSNNQVTTTYNAYDPMGRAKSVSKTISGDGNAYTTQYIYDLSGKLKQTIYPDGYRVSNSFYPGTGLLEAVTGSDSVEYARNSNYEPTGKIGRIDHGNGTYTQHNYDPESTRLASIVSSRSGPTLDLQNKTYQYTKAGNIKQIADNIKGINYDYTYDKLHRLKTETNTGSYDLISYDYDPLGNILSKTVGSATMDYNYQGPRPHAVKTIKINGANYDYAYDDNGNMISGPDFTDPQQVAQRTISYNADNMPRSISHTKGGNTVTTNFDYDGNGTRARKQIPGGSTTYYIGDHYEVKDGVATKFIFAGNLRVAKIAGSGINYFHKDHLGSSTVISDNNGNAIETSDYMPFGNLRDHTGITASNYKFTDQEFDPSSGLYNYNARLYDPIIGRFISPDPFVQAAFDPQTLNRYSYVRNNPLIYIDPSGYSFFSKVFKKVKKVAKKAVKRILPIAVGVTVGLITGQPILGAMAAGAVSGGMDGGTDGAVLGAIFGLFTGGLSAGLPTGAMSGDSTFITSFKMLLSSGLQAVHAHVSSAIADGRGGSKANYRNNSVNSSNTVAGSVPFVNYSSSYGGNLDHKFYYGGKPGFFSQKSFADHLRLALGVMHVVEGIGWKVAAIGFPVKAAALGFAAGGPVLGVSAGIIVATSLSFPMYYTGDFFMKLGTYHIKEYFSMSHHHEPFEYKPPWSRD